MELLLENISCTVRDGGHERILVDVQKLHLKPAQSVALAGSSGAGKTTFLNLLCGLLLPKTGNIAWNRQNICNLPESSRDAWRRQHVGLIFQDFRLLPGLSALDNVLLPAGFGHMCCPENIRVRAEALLARLELKERHRKTALLSRGEMQRVALARALLFSPSIILADEPTASLDQENAATVTELLLESAKELSCTLVVVSHDPALRARMERELVMEHGKIQEAA